MMTNKYALPPLPEALIVSYQTDSTMRSMELRTYSGKDMRDYARAAIEADRQRRGEPVAYLHAGNLERLAQPHVVGCAASIQKEPADGFIPIFTAPQPAEPVLYTSQKALDLASRSDAVVSVGLTRVPQMSWNVPLYTAPQPAEPVTPRTQFEDARVQKVYEIICGDNHPPFGEHWDGYVSRLIVDALFPAEPADVDHGETRVNIGLKAKTGCDLGGVVDHGEAEPVKVPNALPSGTNYSVEPHGNGYAIYQGRDGLHHGANLAHLTECTPEFSKRIESALNAMSEPVKVPSDSAIMFEWSQTPNTGDMRVDLIAFARALLARYGQPVEPVKPCLIVKYDEKGDSLYICCDSSEPADAEENEQGILLWRAYSDGRLVGVTIPNFIGPMSNR